MTKISPLKWQSKIFIFNLLIVLSSLFIAEAAYLQGWFLTLENMFYDSCQRYNGVESDYSPHVVIVKIDRKTMQKYNDLPMAFWGPYFAEALSRLRLCKVRAIGLDMIFTVSPEDCLLKLGVKSTNLVRAYDVDFRSQLNMGEIILAGKAVMTKTGPGKIILPTDDYLYALHDASASIGLANFIQDTDGVIRSYIPRLFSGNSTPNLSFAALLMIKAGITIPDQGLSRIIFIGPPGSVPRLSFLDLLKADKKQFAAIKTLLRNKLVIISVEDNGFDDFHLTPYATGLSISKEIKLMSGAELIENRAVLSKRAEKLLLSLGYKNIEFKIGDGSFGWKENAPFDGIICTFSPDHIPPALLDQLAIGGRMIIPVSYSSKVQEFILIEKEQSGKLKRTNLIPLPYVPNIRRKNGE